MKGGEKFGWGGNIGRKKRGGVRGWGLVNLRVGGGIHHKKGKKKERGKVEEAWRKRVEGEGKTRF